VPYGDAVRLVDTEPRTLTELTFLSARSGGGTEVARLTVDGLRVDRLPAGCDAVVVASDLQGVAPSPYGGESVLLGIALADYLSLWADDGWLPPPVRVGVILAGDLYSAPQADRRGASGDVTDVWRTFALAGCPLVTGVAGNHDAIHAGELDADATAVLDGTVVERGGVRIGGVGGVIGDPAKRGRRSEGDFLRGLGAVLDEAPDVLVLHEGPPGQGAQRGNPMLGEVLARRGVGLTVCGHVHWSRPVARLGDGHVLNVDARVIVLTA